MKLHTISRDKKLYCAEAIFEKGTVTVLKGSKINLSHGGKYDPCEEVANMRANTGLFDGEILIKDITFDSLSQAATFVTGRTANGKIVWKTEDNKYVRYALEKAEDIK